MDDSEQWIQEGTKSSSHGIMLGGIEEYHEKAQSWYERSTYHIQVGHATAWACLLDKERVC
jgi:hypothetical protein